ncbi:MAG: hypothetical protein J7L39_01245 [Candidatus Aenigmarchaeota archaeon]|nr:hypothetical protein [Candidatus Aenigmarchaeota archaeon]
MNNKYYSPKEVEIAIKIFLKNHKFKRSADSIDDIEKFLATLAESIKKGEFSATIIGKYIYNTITNKKSRKRKASAFNFEELLADFFGGKLLDRNSRKAISLTESNINNLDKEIIKRILRNKLEKGDLIIKDYILSVKTLVPSNKELNVGSFSSEALFKGFLKEVPQERLHLGSKPLLKKILKKIESEGKWEAFVRRFNIMVNEIFVYDFIIGIKDDKILDVYLIDSNAFRKLLIDHVKRGPDTSIKLLNRFEAHALRIELNKVLKRARHIKIELFGRSTKKLERLISISDKIRLDIIKKLCEYNDDRKVKEYLAKKRFNDYF